MLSGLMSRWMIEKRVGGAERVGRLRHDPAGLFHRELAPAPDPARHRLAVHVAHDEVDQAVALADRVDRDDVRMGELGGGLGLAGEALPDVLLEGELGGKHLDGDPALEPLVAGAVDDAHAAPPDLALDGIRVTQRRGEPGRQRLVGGCGHGRPESGEPGRGRRGGPRRSSRTWQTICTRAGPAATLRAVMSRIARRLSRQDPSLRSG